MKTFKSPTADEFKTLRKKRHLSQAQIAELLAVSTNSVKNWEHGRSTCSPQVWGFMCYRLEERDQEIRERLLEHARRWKSRAYRNEWKRKARERFGD
jgi:transcriptional regulator with XRE-family HTH domain